jgi:hypothetical protein
VKKNKRAFLDELKGPDEIEEQKSLSNEKKLRKDEDTVKLEKTIV